MSEQMQREIDGLRRALLKAEACFTCGSPAVKLIFLKNGCACFPHVTGLVPVCAQHLVKVQPL